MKQRRGASALLGAALLSVAATGAASKPPRHGHANEQRTERHVVGRAIKGSVPVFDIVKEANDESSSTLVGSNERRILKRDGAPRAKRTTNVNKLQARAGGRGRGRKRGYKKADGFRKHHSGKSGKAHPSADDTHDKWGSNKWGSSKWRSSPESPSTAVCNASRYRTCFLRAVDPKSDNECDVLDRSEVTRPYATNNEKLITGELSLSMLKDASLDVQKNLPCKDIVEMEETLLTYLADNVGSEDTFQPICAHLRSTAYAEGDVFDTSKVVSSAIFKFDVTYVTKLNAKNWRRGLEADGPLEDWQDGSWIDGWDVDTIYENATLVANDVDTLLIAAYVDDGFAAKEVGRALKKDKGKDDGEGNKKKGKSKGKGKEDNEDEGKGSKKQNDKDKGKNKKNDDDKEKGNGKKKGKDDKAKEKIKEKANKSNNSNDKPARQCTAIETALCCSQLAVNGNRPPGQYCEAMRCRLNACGRGRGPRYDDGPRFLQADAAEEEFSVYSRVGDGKEQSRRASGNRSSRILARYGDRYKNWKGGGGSSWSGSKGKRGGANDDNQRKDCPSWSTLQSKESWYDNFEGDATGGRRLRRDRNNKRTNGRAYGKEKCPAYGILRHEDMSEAITCLTPFDPQETYAQLDLSNIDDAAYCAGNRHSLQSFGAPTLECEEFYDAHSCGEKEDEGVGRNDPPKHNDDLLPVVDEILGSGRACYVADPTLSPTLSPTLFPTVFPTWSPTLSPTIFPTMHPTLYPTFTPTLSPTLAPTSSDDESSSRSSGDSWGDDGHDDGPTKSPTKGPTGQPSPASNGPTRQPTRQPTNIPTQQGAPTRKPTQAPSPPPSPPTVARCWDQVGNDIDGSDFVTGVALSKDGSMLVVANVPTSLGDIRTYKWENSAWTQLAPDLNNVGQVIALSSDGSTLAVGHFTLPETNRGRVTLYKLVDNQWVQDGVVEGENNNDALSREDLLFVSLDLSADGTILAFGTPGSDGSGTDAGRVRVFKRVGADDWDQVGSIDGKAAGDRFGVHLSLSGDGTALAIGADLHDGSGVDSGHVQVYDWDGTTNWNQRGLDIVGENENDWFGSSVSLSEDGNILAVGDGKHSNSPDSSQVRVYNWSGSAWGQLGEAIEADPEYAPTVTPGEVPIYEGYTNIDLSADGTILAVGAPDKNDGNSVNDGNTRVFEWNGASWDQLGGSIQGETQDDRTGVYVSLSGDGQTLATGSYWSDGQDGSNAGHARVFAAGFSSSPDGSCKPTDQLVPCVAVIDEDDDNGSRNTTKLWEEFREEYPDRPFCLLRPVPPFVSQNSFCNRGECSLTIPPNFANDVANDPRIKYHNVTRDKGNVTLASDWAALCGLDNANSRKIGYVGLFVDFSPSLGLEDEVASYGKFIAAMDAAGIEVKEVKNSREDWITPFTTVLV